MIDREKARALERPDITETVERGRLRLFAQVTGQNEPVYTDLDAARAAGHPDLPVPPTFLFGLELSGPDPFGHFAELGVNLTTLLHGEQEFTYHAMVHAGDTVTLRRRILDVETKKGGALELVTTRTEFTRDGEPVAEARSTIVVRHR